MEQKTAASQGGLSQDAATQGDLPQGAALNPAVPQGAAPRAYRAIFFDLDGTLLPMDVEEFLTSYFKAIGTFVGRQGFDAQAFLAGLKAGTKAMMAHDDACTNAQAYWDTFYSCVDKDALDWEPVLMGFYEDEFARIGEGVRANPAAARALSVLAAKGYPLVLATMPMFPRRAVEHRLAWAGVDAGLFARLTSYDNSTATKPQLIYYAENLAACGLRGEDVLMVGNNTVEDLAAMQLGCDAFLVIDHLLDPTGDFDLSAVKHGSMEEFAAWVERLPPCEHPAEGIDAGAVDRAAGEAALAANRAEGTAEWRLEDERAFYEKRAPQAGALLTDDGAEDGPNAGGADGSSAGATPASESGRA